MTTSSAPQLSIFVHKSRQQWIVRDSAGNFWIVPSVENPWQHREPFELTEDDTDLEPVPGHYRYLLEIPL